METRAPFILVGFFTLAAVAALLLFALWVTGAGSERDVKYYEILFREAVYGLSVGSPVQYSGIRVGQVDQVMLDPEDPRLVRALIQVSASTPVKVDTRASQQLMSITGASSIELSGGLPESPALSSPDGVPVIEATPSSLSQLRVTSEELLLSASTLLDRANGLFSDENAARVTRVLDNVDAVTSALAGQQEVMQAGIESLVQSSQSLDAFLTQANTQLNRYSGPMFDSVSTTLAELRAVSQQFNNLLTESTPSVSSGMQGFADLAPAMRELRAILANLNSITRELATDPTGYLLGGDSIREFRP